MSLFPDQRWLWDGIFWDPQSPNLGIFIPGDQEFFKYGDFYTGYWGFSQNWGFL